MTKPTPKQRAVIDFWDDQKILPILDAPGNFWDSLKWWQKLGLSCAIVVVLWLVAAVVFHK